MAIVALLFGKFTPRKAKHAGEGGVSVRTARVVIPMSRKPDVPRFLHRQSKARKLVGNSAERVAELAFVASIEEIARFGSALLQDRES